MVVALVEVLVVGLVVVDASVDDVEVAEDVVVGVSVVDVAASRVTLVVSELPLPHPSRKSIATATTNRRRTMLNHYHIPWDRTQRDRAGARMRAVSQRVSHSRTAILATTSRESIDPASDGNDEPMTTLTAADGHAFDNYEVHADGATASIVIVQEIFGVNPHIRSVVDRYAAMGYRVIAPALFDRTQRGVELDYTADGVAEGKKLRAELDWDDSMLDVAAAVDAVATTGPVGVIGYCYGGSIAWLAASTLPIAGAVGYYGGQIHDFRGKAPAVPVMLHFGAMDKSIQIGRAHV